MTAPTIAESARIDRNVQVGSDCTVWEFVHIRENATVGEGTTLGRGAYVGSGVSIGKNCKIQNYALLYEPATLGDGVFVGPAAVLTNDKAPRAINPDGTRKQASDWQPLAVHVESGASLGANSVCVAPVRIGSWAMVAAGAVVVEDVLDHQLVAGVPARPVGWVGRTGAKLRPDGEANSWICDVTGERFVESAAGLQLCSEGSS